MQEVFLAVWRGRESFAREQPGQSFRGWLRIIVRNKITDYFRTNTTLVAAKEPAYLLDDHPAPAESSMVSGAERRHFRHLLDRALEAIRADFEPGTWQAFQLSALQNRATAEIAHDLGMTPAAVRQAKYKVLRRLRAELGGGP